MGSRDMNQNTAVTTRDVNLFNPFILLILFIPPLLLHILKRIITSPSSKAKPLPPGPRPWPFIGNIPHIGKCPHLSFTNFANLHGPLISLRLGSQLLVVGSSPVAATQILNTHDRLLSGRYIGRVSPFEKRTLDRMAVVWASSCTDDWKSLRTLCRTELFSAKAMESQAVLKEKKVAEMVNHLKNEEGDVVDVGEVVFTTVFNSISNLLLSKDFICLEDKVSAGEVKDLIWRMMKIGAAPNIADFYPIFARFDPQGLKHKFMESLKDMFKLWETCIEERRESYGHDIDDPAKKDFLDVFLANGFDEDKINWLFLELFSAGTDTTTTVIEWAMAELLKNKDVMEKLCEELERQEINRNSIKETQVSQLPYLNACVKETLRLHPPAPFLIPHRATETCEVMNYTIPKDSRVFVNVWAIGRDPSVWEDPLSFKPERFLGSNMDFKGHDFEFLPFGAGRRMCPGLPMATKQLNLILAALVHCFHWSLPNGEDPSVLDMNEKFGIMLQKELPLLFVPKTKL